MWLGPADNPIACGTSRSQFGPECQRTRPNEIVTDVRLARRIGDENVPRGSMPLSALQQSIADCQFTDAGIAGQDFDRLPIAVARRKVLGRISSRRILLQLSIDEAGPFVK